MSSTTPPGRHRKSTPCRLYAQGQGHCRFGDRCRFSHDVSVAAQPSQVAGNRTPLDQTCHHQEHDATSSDQPSRHDASDARPRPKRGEIPCRAWKAGTCTKGTKCWFSHDIEVLKPGPEPSRSHKQKQQQKVTATSSPVQVEDSSIAAAEAVLRALQRHQEEERVREQQAQAAAAAAAARERANAIAREEAAKTMSQVVDGSIVTFGAGLDVPSLVTGFETCTLRITNLPSDMKEDDILALLIGQGVDLHRFHLVIKRRSNRPEAHIVTDVASGRAISAGLDGTEYQEETLMVEMSSTNSLEGMSATTGQSSEVLTISWRAPSARYVAEYVDVETANAKVREFDRTTYGSRRLKVEMNTQPRGRYIPNLRLNAIKINNLPSDVTDADVREFTGSVFVKRLLPGGIFGISYSIEEIARLVREDIGRAVPGGMKTFDCPPKTCTMEGIVSARAHFSSWDEAHIAYTHLSDKRYGHQPVWLRLPDPMHFTLVIPMEQYNAQREQWNSLLSSIKDRKACTLNIRELGNAVRVQLSGSVKEATGALKVRVENLARGDKVEGWHRSFGFQKNPFAPRVHAETGAYLRADWKRQILKVYGAPGAVDRARELIKVELERLASLDYTVTIAQNSVGFFVREGIQQLKETLGEDNVRFAMSTRKLTVSGGEDARHTLDRLIMLSHKSDDRPPSAAQGDQTCPICYDNVSAPHQLGCGHTYCVACLRHFLLSAFESDQFPLTCLGDEARCRVPIAIPTIQQFLPPASFNRLLEAAFDAYVEKHPEELKPCKTPDCTQLYRAARAGTAPQTLQCPSCFSALCNGCHEDGHDGLSCAEVKARQDSAEHERLNDAWIASQGGRVKKCPRCNVLIEKVDGCNHMSCKCGAHICWRCMGVFSREAIYPHMQSAHGTYYDNAPAAAAPQPVVYAGPPVDIEEQRELLRQVELRRAAAAQNANPNERYFMWNQYDEGYADFAQAQQRARERQLQQAQEDLERRRREREAQERLRQEREAQERLRREWEERERRAREQRLQTMRREAEERRRAQQESKGWNCTIM